MQILVAAAERVIETARAMRPIADEGISEAKPAAMFATATVAAASFDAPATVEVTAAAQITVHSFFVWFLG